MTESRKKNVFLNVIFGYIAQVGIILLSFIGRKIFLNYLSIEYLGINGLYSNILTILSLPELGVDSAVVYFLYKPVAENNQSAIRAYVKYFEKIYFLLAGSIFLLGLCLLPFLQYIIKSDLPLRDLNIYYVLFLLNTCMSYLAAHKVALLSAYQEQRVQKMAMLSSNIVLQLLYIAVLIIWHNYYLYVITTILGTLTNNLILNILCNKYHPLIKLNEDCRIEKKPILKKIQSTFIYKIGVVLINSTDNVLISVLVSTSAVGLYSNYYTVISGISAFIAIINTSLISSVGNLGAKNESEKQYDYFNLMIDFYHYVAAVGAIGFYMLLNNFITIWLGNEYLFDRSIVFAIAFSFYITTAVNPVWMYREANGLFEKVKYLMIITAVLNIIFSIILGKVWGVFGILLATSISRIVTTIWYEPKVLFDSVFEKKVAPYWKKQIKNVLASVISFFAVSVIIANMSDTILFFCVKGIIVVTVTSIVFIIFNLDKVKKVLRRKENV